MSGGGGVGRRTETAEDKISVHTFLQDFLQGGTSAQNLPNICSHCFWHWLGINTNVHVSTCDFSHVLAARWAVPTPTRIHANIFALATALGVEDVAAGRHDGMLLATCDLDGFKTDRTNCTVLVQVEIAGDVVSVGRPQPPLQRQLSVWLSVCR